MRTSSNSRWHGGKLLLVHYEELKAELEPGLKEIRNFLRLNPDPERLKCILNDRDGSYKRPEPEKKEFPFTKSQIDFVMGHLCNVSRFLEYHAIKPLPFQLYMKSIQKKFTEESLGHLDLENNCVKQKAGWINIL